jgi:hypothetical protein
MDYEQTGEVPEFRVHHTQLFSIVLFDPEFCRQCSANRPFQVTCEIVATERSAGSRVHP